MKRSLIIVSILLVAYLAILAKLIVFKFPPGVLQSGINLVPFSTILPYLTGEPNWAIAIRNLVGNILPFAPIGFLIPFSHRRIKWWHILIGGVAISLAFETLQLTLQKGSFDVDDILLNTLGVMLGWALFVAFKRLVIHSRS